VNSGADLIVVGGGDGTLSEATHQLAHRDVCLGVLPLGTTNNFARSLGLPLNLSGALRTLTQGKVANVDLGHVTGRHYANLTSLGMSVQVAQHVPHRLKLCSAGLPTHSPRWRCCPTTGHSPPGSADVGLARVELAIHSLDHVVAGADGHLAFERLDDHAPACADERYWIDEVDDFIAIVSVVLDRFDYDGLLAALLRPATTHPWPKLLPPHPYGGGRTAYRRVAPEVVVELSVDLAMDGPRWRHPVRFVRVRGELTAADLVGEMRAV
jgi:hypothetical protein